MVMSDFATVAALVGLVGAAAPLADVARPLVALPVDPAVLTLFSAGVVGMSIKNVFDSILSDDEDGDAESGEQMGDGAGLMGEDGGDDDLGGLGGLDEGGDDEFGDFGDDEFGDMDGGADTDELQHRLDELETEVGSLSSTVNTVRNENEQISETVDDVEENVRKLLDIYEMVTRGVNPFADDIDSGLGGPGEGESFGLFEGGDDQEEDEDLDEDIANADAEGFFDDDLVEDESDDDFGGSVEDVMGGGSSDDPSAEDAFEDEFNDDAFDVEDDMETDDFGDDMTMDEDFDDNGSDGGGGDGGGKSFQELKDEYESGDAEWAEGDESNGDGSSTGDFEDAADEFDDADGFDDGDESLDDPDGAFGDSIGEEDDAADEGGDDLADDDLFDTVIEDDGDTESESTTDPEPAQTTEPDTEPEPESKPEQTAEPESQQATDSESESQETAEARAEQAPSSGDGKPYLATMPEGFGTELITIEWLEYLVEEVGVRSTAEAIDYYERIDWISEPVADSLQDYLRGFDGSGADGDLTIDHHTKSLKYIGQLDGGASQTATMGHLFSGGGSDGLQR
jgi:archaellum component FlaD/FlaE/archaellum component FlaC